MITSNAAFAAPIEQDATVLVAGVEGHRSVA